MKRKDSILANFYYQSLPKKKEGGNYFNKYKVPQNEEPSYRTDPILKFFNGGFMMPAQEGGSINFPKEKGYTPERLQRGGDISIADLRKPNWLSKYPDGGTPPSKYSWQINPRELARQNMSSSTDANLAAKIKADAIAAEKSKMNEMRRKQGEIRQGAPKRSAASKAWAIATNPVTALSYKVKGQVIPENFERGSLNAYDQALNIVNPLSYIEQARQVKNDFGEGNYLGAAIGTLGLIPGEGALEKNIARKIAYKSEPIHLNLNNYGLTSDADWDQRVYDIIEGDNKIGHITLPIGLSQSGNPASAVKNNAIDFVHLDPEFRGKGYGVSAYKQLISDLNKENKTLYNYEDALTKGSRSVWDKLVDEGFATKKGDAFYSTDKMLKKFGGANNMNWLRKYVDGGPKDPPPGDAEKKFIMDWNNSPMAKQMLEASVDKDDPYGINSSYADKMRIQRNSLTNRAPVKVGSSEEIANEYNKTSTKEAGPGLGGFARPESSEYKKSVSEILGRTLKNPGSLANFYFGDSAKGVYSTLGSENPQTYKYGVYAKDFNGNKNVLNETLVHELSHASDYGGLFIPESDKKKMDKYAYGWDKGMPMRKKLSDFNQYVADPTETRARLMNFRYNAANQKLYDPFNQKINLQQLKKYKETPGGYDPLGQLRDVYTDEQIVDMLNTISAANPLGSKNPNMVKYGGWLNKYPDGGPTPKYSWQTDLYPRNVSESTSFGTTQMKRNADRIVTQVNQDKTAIENYKRANPWASSKSDSEILGLIDINNKSIQNQGTIKQAAPKRSKASKAWAIASNPMTALKYKVKGQDIPENFERGERNVLDMAVDVVNPATYINAGGRTLLNASQPLTTGKRLFSGVGQLSANLVGDDAGWDNVLDAAGIVGDAAMFVPFGKGLKAASQELKPFMQQATRTYNLTSDLPRFTRLKNALNAGTTKYHLKDIDDYDYTHHVFGSHMTPEEALAEIRAQRITAPRGALMGDTNMSLNSTPLYFQSAARDVKNFPVVRTGDFQSLNSMGFKGKKISQSIPQRLYTEHPEVVHRYNLEVSDINARRNDLINSLDPNLPPSLRARELARIDQMHKTQMSQIAPEKEAITFMNEHPDLFNEFYTAYKPHLDRPISVLNESTGLNFPGTRASFQQYGPKWEAPTAFSVKGSFAPRYRGIAKQAGNRFLNDSKVRTFVRSNDEAFRSYSDELTNINQRFNNEINDLQRAFDEGRIDDFTYGDRMDDAGRIRDMQMRVFRNKYPEGKPAITETSIDITPSKLAIPGILNKQFGSDKANSEVEIGLVNAFKNAGSYRNAKLRKYGGQSWLNKYPTGGPVPSASNVALSPVPQPAPTPQTGSPNQYGPTFSNQTGYVPEDKRGERRDKMLSALKLGVFMGGLLSGDDKKKSQETSKPKEQTTTTQQNNTQQNNKPIGVDGNGNPLPDIAWNYNPAMKAQKPDNPFLQEENPGGGLYESTGMMARRGGDVSIYGRRNYRADTPSFYNFGGMINGLNINNNTNWLKKYKS